MLARIHDLLEIDAERFLKTHSFAPEWVAHNLRLAPFVVVRRGPISEHEIAIGVRGEKRNERWAAACHPGLVNNILTPQNVLGRAVPASRMATVPALRSLSILAERWKDLDSPWGPGGSVGFELATGRPVVRLQSDLDVVICARAQMTKNQARHLRDSALGLPAVVDIRVETPSCGFSLVEYANRAPTPILLRVASGATLGADPWNELGATRATHAIAGGA
jgi:phosphoribosyl-dephospho-CoA transferase